MNFVIHDTKSGRARKKYGKKAVCMIGAVSCFGWCLGWWPGPCRLQMHSLIYLLFASESVSVCSCVSLCFCFYLLVSNHCCRIQCHDEKILQRRARREKISKQQQQQTNARTKHSSYSYFSVMTTSIYLKIVCCCSLQSVAEICFCIHFAEIVMFLLLLVFLSFLLFGTCVRVSVCLLSLI